MALYQSHVILPFLILKFMHKQGLGFDAYIDTRLYPSSSVRARVAATVPEAVMVSKVMPYLLNKAVL